MENQQSPAVDEEVLTADQVSAELGVSKMTLRRRVEEGAITPLPKLAGLKRPYRLMFTRSEVNRLKSMAAEIQ